MLLSGRREGNDRKNKKRIFALFFITKETGKGTGLGLSIGCGTIQKHPGNVSVKSEPGRELPSLFPYPFIE